MFTQSMPLRKSKRRGAGLALAAAAAVLGTGALGLVSEARAQTYPNKPIRFVVGFAPGGPTDILARVVGNAMSKHFGEQIVVENRSGAGGNIATEQAARAPADGYTVLFTLSPNAVNETLFKNFKVRFTEHFEPIGGIAYTGLVVLAHPSLQVSNIADLIKLAKAKPGDLIYATAGAGTSTHLAAELFNSMAGTKLRPVHYKGGGQTIADLLSGEMKLMFSSIPPVLPFVQQGKLKAIATTGPKRDFSLPDLPTVAEQGLAGFDVSLWFGLSVPKGTPAEVRQRLTSVLETTLKQPEVQKALAKHGFTMMPMGPQEFEKFYAAEVAKWAKVLNAIGLRM